MYYLPASSLLSSTLFYSAPLSVFSSTTNEYQLPFRALHHCRIPFFTPHRCAVPQTQAYIFTFTSRLWTIIYHSYSRLPSMNTCLITEKAAFNQHETSSTTIKALSLASTDSAYNDCSIVENISSPKMPTTGEIHKPDSRIQVHGGRICFEAVQPLCLRRSPVIKIRHPIEILGRTLIETTQFLNTLMNSTDLVLLRSILATMNPT